MTERHIEDCFLHALEGSLATVAISSSVRIPMGASEASDAMWNKGPIYLVQKYRRGEVERLQKLNSSDCHEYHVCMRECTLSDVAKGSLSLCGT